MKTLKFIIIAVLLSFITSCCDNKYNISNDKGVVTNIHKVHNGNEVTIEIIRNSKQRDLRGIENLYYVSNK